MTLKSVKMVAARWGKMPGLNGKYTDKDLQDFAQSLSHILFVMRLTNIIPITMSRMANALCSACEPAWAMIKSFKKSFKMPQEFHIPRLSD